MHIGSEPVEDWAHPFKPAAPPVEGALEEAMGQLDNAIQRWHDCIANGRDDVEASRAIDDARDDLIAAARSGHDDAKDTAYNERNRIVIGFATLAKALGWPVGWGWHEGEEWDDEWRNVLYIDTPAGQVSWHFPEHEVDLLVSAYFGRYEGSWDGHATDEKHDRLAFLWTKELVARSRHDGLPGACEVCHYSAWVPVETEAECDLTTIEDHRHVRCDYCWLRAGHDGLLREHIANRVRLLETALDSASYLVLDMLKDGFSDSMDQSIEREAKGWQVLAGVTPL